MKTTRPSIPLNTKITVWAAAAGRCTICNKYILENEDLGEAVPIGELAHNVGWSKKSPRGKVADSMDRSDPDNLLLLCRSCHKPIDLNETRYTVERLKQLKSDHESRIRRLTQIGADKQAVVLRMVGAIRNVPPELTYDTVLDATVSEGCFPKLLPNSHRNEIEIDLRDRTRAGTSAYFEACAQHISDKVAAIHDSVRLDSTTRLAVFGFARIPLLVHLGAVLDDKVNTVIFQRQRVDDGNPWAWPKDSGVTPSFKATSISKGTDKSKVAILLNLSGTVKEDELPDEISSEYTTYAINPAQPATPNPNLINSRQAVANFEREIRALLAQLERDHGKLERVSVFPAIPVSAAVTLGRALMPNISPSLEVFDRDETGKFFMALEVHR